MEKLLIIEDVQSLRDQLKWGLGQEYEILEGSSRDPGMELFLKHAPKVVMLDLGLPPDADGTSEGFRCLDAMIQTHPEVKIIVLTGNQKRETAYRAVASGAYDFYQKPVDLTELKIIIRRAFHLYGIEEQGRRLQEALQQSRAGIEGIAGSCATMRELLNPLQKGQRQAAPEAEPRGLDPSAGVHAEAASSAHRRRSHGGDEYEVSMTAGHLTLREVRDRVEKSMIHAAVDNCGGNMARASELLGVSRPALYDLMKKHGLFKPSVRQ